MRIGGFLGTRALTAQPTEVERAAPALPDESDSPASNTRISSPGRLFSRLAQLSHDEPERFKEVAQQIADDLRASAAQSSGREAAFDNRLAERFEKAAETGDMSSLFPRRSSEAPQHHRGAHGGGEETRSVLEHALDLVHEEALAPEVADDKAP